MESKIEDKTEVLWVKTDDLQYVKRICSDTFEVVEVVCKGWDFGISQQVIYLHQHEKSEIFDCIKTFGYKSVDEVYEIYSKNAANQIIAECLAECSPDIIEGLSFETREEALAHIEFKIIALEREFHLKNISAIEIINKRIEKFQSIEKKCMLENRPVESLRFKHYIECLEIVLSEIKEIQI